MLDTLDDAPISVFATSPPFRGDGGAEHLDRIVETARWSEEWGCDGTLVYTDNGQLDPWTVSQAIIGATESLSPLVAVQPVYMHPYTVAKNVSTLGHLYGRRVWLNMVAGGFRNDLSALGDRAEHDRRYERLVEYTTIVAELLRGDGPVSLDGRFYSVENLKLRPPLDPELFPGIVLAGSSDAGRRAAATLDAVGVRYPKPAEEAPAARDDDVEDGIRVGIIARPTEEDAWAEARARFPEDPRGKMAHRLAMKVSDSVWHQRLSEAADKELPDSPYWMVPFENYKTFCPYLVGSYRTVGEELRRHVEAGCSTVILDVPRTPDDFHHTTRAFDEALTVAAA